MSAFAVAINSTYTINIPIRLILTEVEGLLLAKPGLSRFGWMQEALS